MSDAEIIYYQSSVWVLGFAVLFFAGVIAFWFFKKSDLSTSINLAIGSGLIFIACVAIATVFYGATRYPNDRFKKLVINEHYLSCGSWHQRDGRLMQVPWSAFTDINVYYSRRGWSDPHLRFDLDRSKMSDFLYWSDYIRAQGWVACDITNLTDQPERIIFPSTSDEIYSRVVSAWQAAQLR